MQTGGTVTGTITVSVGTGSAFTGNSSGGWFGLFPANLGQGGYNSIVQTGDNGLIFSGGTVGSGALSIAPWANATSGIRITGAGAINLSGTTTVNGNLTATNITATNTLTVTNTISAAILRATYYFNNNGQQGAYLAWNKDNGGGGTWLLNQKGAGAGGFHIGEVDTADNVTDRIYIEPNGVVLIPGGNFQVGQTGTQNPVVLIDGAVGTNRTLAFYTDAAQRFDISLDTYPESGGNVGSNFRIARFADNGSFLDFPLTIDRSDGHVTIPDGLLINSPAGWSSNNAGKGLLVTTSPGVTNPMIGITDANQTNLWGIGNFGNTLMIAAMPAYTDTTTAPAYVFQLDRGGDLTLIGNLALQQGSLTLPRGNGSTGGNSVQITFGWANSPNYPHYIATRHDGLTSPPMADIHNAIDFYLCAGASAGSFPSSAIWGGSITAVGLSLPPGTATSPSLNFGDAFGGGHPAIGLYLNGNVITVTGAMTVSGAMTFSGNAIFNSPIIMPNNTPIDFTDAQGSNSTRLTLQSDNNFVFYASNSTGGSRGIWSIYVHSDTTGFQVNPLIVASSGMSSYGNISLGYYAWPSLVLNATPNTGAQLIGEKNGLNHWVMRLGSDAVMTPYWAASTAYAANSRVLPPTNNGYSYTNSAAGTSGATAPAWPTTIGATVVDGTVTWTCAALTNTGSDFSILRYSDSGAYIDSNLSITRSTGVVSIGHNSGAGLQLYSNSVGNGDCQIQLNANGNRSWLIGSQGSTFAPGQFIIFDVTSQLCPVQIAPAGGNVYLNVGLTVSGRITFGGSDNGQVWDDGNFHLDGNSNFWIGHNVAGSNLIVQAILNPQMGTTYGSVVAASTVDLSKHIALFGGTYGLCITGNRLNIVAPNNASVVSVVNGYDVFIVGGGGTWTNGTMIASSYVQSNSGVLYAGPNADTYFQGNQANPYLNLKPGVYIQYNNPNVDFYDSAGGLFYFHQAVRTIASGGGGAIGISGSGNTTNCGWVGFYNNAGTRCGYFGNTDGSWVYMAAENGVAGYQCLQRFVVAGMSETYGVQLAYANVISKKNGGNPSCCCWDNSMGYACGIFCGGSNQLYFGQMDGNGNYTGGNWYGNFDNGGNLTTRGQIYSSGNIVAAGSIYPGNGNQPNWVLWGQNPWSWYQHTSDMWRVGFNGSTGDWAWIRGYDGQWSMHLDGSGNLTCSGAICDIRVKKDIEPFTRGMDAIMQLNTVSFGYNGRCHVISDRRHVGIHAQDLIEVIPEAVIAQKSARNDPDFDELYVLDTQPVLMACVNALKQLNARLAEIERIIS
jgi:hypothetical protein